MALASERSELGGGGHPISVCARGHLGQPGTGAGSDTLESGGAMHRANEGRREDGLGMEDRAAGCLSAHGSWLTGTADAPEGPPNAGRKGPAGASAAEPRRMGY